MKKYTVFLGVAVLVLSAVFLSGCNEENNGNNNGGSLSAFVGDWKFDQDFGTYTFYDDGKGKAVWEQKPEGETFTWKVNASGLCIRFSGDARCGFYKFSDNYNTLTWSLKRGEDTIDTVFEKI